MSSESGDRSTAFVQSEATDPVRVLCISSHRGSLNNVRPEAAWIAGMPGVGIAMTVMTQEDSVCAEQMRAAGCEVIHFETGGKFNIRSIREIRRVLRDGGYQIVHMFNNKAIINGIIAATGLPVKIVTYRGQTGNIKRYDPSCYLTHLNPRVDCISCVSEAVRTDLLAQGIPAQKLVTIYKGHDIAWYDGIKKEDPGALGIPDDAFSIACVANNRPRKGVPVLIESTRHLPADSPVHIILVGNGMTSQAVRDLVATSPIAANFHLIDYRNNVLELVAGCDATVLPATKREGLPKTVVESMALGVTPIVTHTGGSPELVVDGECGLVVPPNDAPALAKAILRLSGNRAENAAMGKKARQRLATHFTLEQSIEGHRRLYESLVAADGFSPHSRQKTG